MSATNIGVLTYVTLTVLSFRTPFVHGQDLGGNYAVFGDECSHASGHCCECTSSYGRCMLGDEFPLRSGCGIGPSCSIACKGEYAWKSTYRQARANETALVRSWWKGGNAPAPARKWASPPSNGRFAVMFSGELRRNFIATFFSWTSNVVQASGGAVDLYFDVWAHRLNPLSAASRDLARSHPNTKAYVEETFEEHDKGLRDDHPWLFEALKDKKVRDVYFKSHFGQMRKMWRAYKLVQASGIEYTLVVRGRPDAAILQPLDLRLMHKEYSSLATVRRANGHYIAIPERDPYSVVTDVFAVGTMEAIAAFASPPLPFIQAPHEIFTSQNLERHGIARSNTTILEEIKDPLKNYQSVCCRTKMPDVPDGTPIDFGDTQWELLPPDTRAGQFSPLMSSNAANVPFGDGSCFNEGAACIPMLRMRFTFSLYTALKPWFFSGALCFSKMIAFPKQIHDFLVTSRIGDPVHPRLAKTQTDYHCLKIPGLAQAHAQSMNFACAYLNGNLRLKCDANRVIQPHSKSNPYKMGGGAEVFRDVL